MPTKCIILKDINGIYNCLIADDALHSYFENSATANQLVLTIPVLSGFIIFKFSCLLTCVKHLRRAYLQEAAGSKQLQESGVRINLHILQKQELFLYFVLSTAALLLLWRVSVSAKDGPTHCMEASLQRQLSN